MKLIEKVKNEKETSYKLLGLFKLWAKYSKPQKEKHYLFNCLPVWSKRKENTQPIERVLDPQHQGFFNMDLSNGLFSQDSLNYFAGDIREDYAKLIRGLDEQSVDILARVVMRLQEYQRSGNTRFRFTEQEKQELGQIYDGLYSKIIKLSEDCYAFGKYLLPAKVISPTSLHYQHFMKDLETLEAIEKKNIIDVGGFIGDSALIFSPYTQKKVYSFEPMTLLYDLLEKTIAFNELGNVEAVKMGLGSQSAEMEMALNTANMGLKGNVAVSDEIVTERVKIGTLDEFVAANKLEVGLIKVDIEGAEQDFLKGAEKTIKTQKPALLLSIYHNASDFFKIKPLIESWNLGYRFKVARPSTKAVVIDTTLIAEVR